MSLRNVLAAQARFVRGTLDEADLVLSESTRIDPSFKPFVERCEREGVKVAIVSSGIAPLIERALARNGIRGVPVLANEVTPEAGGWVMHFRDESANGHDKAAAVRAAAAGEKTVAYVGDGYSDYDGALEAQIRFAKRGRSLERFLRKRGVPFTPFTSFAEVEKALFP